MKVISVRVLPWTDVSKADQQLMQQAIMARHRSQCDYSQYAVGAAVRTESGDMSVGQNVETVTWTQTTHAEQSAITASVTASGPGFKVDTIAVVGAPKAVRINGPEDVWGESPESMESIFGPCGHCRQIIWENAHGDPDVRVLMLEPSGEVSVTTMGDLFPMAFGPDNL